MAMRLTAMICGVCLLGGAAAGTPLAAACSGGSGGTGYSYTPSVPSTPSTPATPQSDPTYVPVSTAFPSIVSTDAPSQNHVLVVLQDHRTPIGIWDEDLASRSKTMPFVLYEDGDAQQFASRWGIDALPAVALCDRAGNLIALTAAPITAKHVHELIDDAAAEEADLSADLQSAYQRAERASTSQHMAAALATLDAILRYQALPVCAQAQTLRQRLLAQGHEAVAGAVASGDPGRSRTALGALIRAYQGTEVADEARQVLQQHD